MKNLVVFLTITLCLATTCWFVIKCDVVTWPMFIPVVIAFLLVTCYTPWVFGLPFLIFTFLLYGVALPMLISSLTIWLVWMTIELIGGPKYQSDDGLLIWSLSFGVTVLFWIWVGTSEARWRRDHSQIL